MRYGKNIIYNKKTKNIKNKRHRYFKWYSLSAQEISLYVTAGVQVLVFLLGVYQYVFIYSPTRRLETDTEYYKNRIEDYQDRLKSIELDIEESNMKLQHIKNENGKYKNENNILTNEINKKLNDIKNLNSNIATKTVEEGLVYLSLRNIYYNYFIDALVLECAGEIEKAVKIHKKISIYDIIQNIIIQRKNGLSTDIPGLDIKIRKDVIDTIDRKLKQSQYLKEINIDFDHIYKKYLPSINNLASHISQEDMECIIDIINNVKKDATTLFENSLNKFIDSL